MGSPPRVLLVDDRPDDLDRAAREVRRELGEAEVRVARDAPALAAALAGPVPDLVVTGSRPRWADGLAVLRAVKERWPECPVIVVAGTGSEEASAEALRSGLDAHVTESGRLGAALRDTLARRWERRALREAARRDPALLDGVPVGLYRADGGGRLREVNPALVRMLGYPDRAALLGVPPEGLWVRGQDGETLRRRLVREGEVGGFAALLRRHDGGELVAVLDAWGERGPAGEVDGHEAAVTDVVERRRALAALREREARFRTAFERSATGIAIQGIDGRYLQVNPALCRILGYPERELLDLTFAAVTHPDEAARDLEEARRLLTGERSWYQREKRYVRKDGSTVWGLVSASLVRDGDDRPGYLVVQVQDLTDPKRAAAELARQQERLFEREKIAAMGELLAGVAHELNNPLAVVMGQAELLQRSVEGGKVAERAQRVATAAERCARIVRNFLALARRQPTVRQETSLNQVVEEALEILVYPLRVDTIEVVLDRAPEIPAVWADPHQLHQVVVNLVTNAQHALRQTAGPRRVVLRTYGDAATGRVGLEVRDTGPGIPSAVRARIFEPFFTTKPVGQGTGLGLPLCRAIVEGHGGTIEVESGAGEGAAFRVELPVGEPDAHGRAADPAAAPDLAGRRILVVDDEPDVAELLADLLAAQGAEVATAGDGLAALAMLDRARFDLVVSDLRMPRLDGPGFYRAARERDPGLAERFVFLTGDTLGPEAAAFLQAHGRFSVPKPFTVQDVCRAVGRALGQG